MYRAIYYYKFADLNDYIPFSKLTFSSSLIAALGVENLNNIEVPSDLTTSATIYNELFSLVIGKHRNLACIKITKFFNEEPTSEEKAAALKEFYCRYLSLLNDTYEVYMVLLKEYAAARDSLMADIKATSKNKVKFNDTPQNPNNLEVYEGDDYITHFTKTEGETSSPLMSKIMRLKEIQENYRDLMSEWTRDFQRIFYEEDC